MTVKGVIGHSWLKDDPSIKIKKEKKKIYAIACFDQPLIPNAKMTKFSLH